MIIGTRFLRVFDLRMDLSHHHASKYMFRIQNVIVEIDRRYERAYMLSHEKSLPSGLVLRVVSTARRVLNLF